MTTHRLLAGLILCLLAAMAGGPALAQSGNPAHDAMLARPDAERRNAFHQSIRAIGNSCQTVQVAFPAGLDGARNAYWDIRCTDGVTYRAMLPAERFAPATFVNCGALVPAPRSGPCFQTLATIAALQANAAAQTQVQANEGACRAQCGGGSGPAQAQCFQSCMAQQATRPAAAQPVTAAPAPAAAPAQGSRFGVVYATEPPLAVWGFANGAADRLEVNMRAVRQCQQAAGQVRCHFMGEVVDQCAALAFAISRHPRAIAITSDPSTQVLNNRVLARAATQAAAEAEALRQCGANLPAGAQCRIVAAGC